MHASLAVRIACLALLALALLAGPAVAQPHPIEVVAHFLSLSEEQIAVVVTVQEQLRQATEPIAREIAARQAALGELLASEDPNPTEVGAILLSIRGLEARVAMIRGEAMEQIRAILVPEQLERLETAAAARPLCQVIPALTALHLL